MLDFEKVIARVVQRSPLRLVAIDTPLAPLAPLGRRPTHRTHLPEGPLRGRGGRRAVVSSTDHPAKALAPR
jgi:hypothetical protein